MMRRSLIALSSIAAALLTTFSAAAPASAGSGAGCSGNTCSVDISQFIKLSSSTGSVGSGAGYVPVNVPPPPCLWQPIGDATSGSQAIVSEWGPNPPSTFQIDQSYKQAKGLLKNPAPGTWYMLPVNPNASAAGKAQCMTMPLYAWVPPGQTPPMPFIPGSTLAAYAYNHMTVPSPQLVANPTTKGYVNLATYIWETGAATGPISVTAALGNQNSATVTATPSKLVISTDGPGKAFSNCGPNGSKYPVGTVPASASGPGTAPDCGVLWTAPDASAVVTGTVTWTVTWSATDGTSGTLPDIQMPGQTAPIPVSEIQSVNGG